ncbi:MAG: hypothetical protein ACI9FB_002056 [Candidatus Azotimanducaceae bacterium]|jgi:GNAT superfamily N-acetyltransferase
MTTNISFRPYTPFDKPVCLALFDKNCPAFFAPNERLDYTSFLDANRRKYELCLVEGEIVGAFGLIGRGLQRKSLHWILLSPNSHGMGIGSSIMDRVSTLARTSEVRLITIAASHKSAPFFARFGAIEVSTIENGWGPGMHRVDMELRL